METFLDCKCFNIDITPWITLYSRSDPNRWISFLYLDDLSFQRNLKVTESRATNQNGLKYKDICQILNNHPQWNKENITRILSANIERRSRLIALKKKDKPQDKVTNIRAIQIIAR